MGEAQRRLPGVRRRTAARCSSACCPRTRTPTATGSAALGLVPLDGGPPRTIRACPRGSTGQVIRRDGVSLWQPVPDTATFLTGDPEGSRTLVRRLDLIGGGWTTLRSEPATVEFHGMPRDGSFLVGTIQSYARPPDFYRLGADFSPRRPPGDDRAAARRPGVRARRDVRDRGPAPRRAA